MDTVLDINTFDAASIDAINGPLSICEGDPANLTLLGNFDNVSWNGVSGSNSFEISNDGPLLIEVSTADGCEADSTVNITVGNYPVLNEITGIEDFCAGSTIPISVLGDYDEIFWNGNQGTGVFNAEDEGDLEITLISDGSCALDTTVQLSFAPSPELSALNFAEGFCPGESVLIEALGNWDEISWNGAVGSNTFEVNTEGNVDVQIATANGCVLDSILFIQAYNDAVVDINEGELLVVTEGTENSLSISTLSGSYSLNWESSGLISCADCPNPGFTATEDMIVEVQLTDNNTGCTASDSITIRVEPEIICNTTAPSGFSPNSDGQNDAFTIYTSADCNLIINVLRIYDRWGNLVFINEDFAPNNQGLGWDGLHKGQNSPLGAYAWYAELLDNQGESTIIKGNVTLIR